MRTLSARAVRHLLYAASALLWFSAACAADPSAPPAALSPAPVIAAWPDTYLGRIEALAVLETLNAELLSHDSATATLEHWCAAHRLAAPASVIAIRVAGIDKPPSPGLRRDSTYPSPSRCATGGCVLPAAA